MGTEKAVKSDSAPTTSRSSNLKFMARTVKSVMSCEP